MSDYTTLSPFSTSEHDVYTNPQPDPQMKYFLARFTPQLGGDPESRTLQAADISAAAWFAGYLGSCTSMHPTAVEELATAPEYVHYEVRPAGEYRPEPEPELREFTFTVMRDNVHQVQDTYEVSAVDISEARRKFIEALENGSESEYWTERDDQGEIHEGLGYGILDEDGNEITIP